MTLKDLVNLSGGFLPNASFENISVVVEDVEVDSLGVVEISNIPIYNIDQNFKLTENAVVTVLPAYDIIKVEGNVYNPGLVVYDKGMSVSKAIELAGGYMPFSLKKRVYIRSASGKITKPKFLNGRFKLLNPGDTVVVPQDPNPENFDITTFISDLSSTLANIAAIIVIVNNN